MDKTICIIGALKEEISGIKGQMAVADSLRFGRAQAFSGSWQGKKTLLLLSGIGKLRARDALSEACARFSLSMVISIGFAGGLHPDLREGDLVIADRIYDGDKVAADSQTVWSLGISETLIDKVIAKCPGTPSHRGGLLTVDEAVCKPEEKRDLGNRYPVIAVDMETAGLFASAREKHLPFLSVRSITDTVDHELVNFASCVDATGEISRIKAGWHILTHPASIPKIRELRGHCRTATHSLTHFVAEFLRLA